MMGTVQSRTSIFVVDDDDSRKYVIALLEDDYDVISCKSGKQAIESYSDLKPQIGQSKGR